MLSIYLGHEEEERANLFIEAEKRYGEIFQVICEPDIVKALQMISRNKIELVLINIDEIEKDKEKIANFKNKACQLRNRIVFIGLTKNKTNCYEAVKLKFNDVLLDLIKQEDVYQMVNNLEKNYPLHNVKITTMPNFSLSVDGELIKFKNKKAMEMLAFLVDQEGVPVNNNQLINSLWPDTPIDEKAKVRCRVTWHNLKETLAKNDIEWILKNNGRSRAVDKERFICDLYELLDGNQHYIQVYGEKYLEEFEWAEDTKGRIVSYLINTNQYNPIDNINSSK